MGKSKNVAVIGAGVVGLSTAVCIQKEIPHCKVTIFADKIGSDTLSDGAAGIFRPEINVHHDFERVSKWCEGTLSHFLEILQSEDAAKAGIQLVSGYHLSSAERSENTLLKKLIPHHRKLNKEEKALFPQQYKYGVFYTTTVTDCRYYLPWMKSKFEEAGGTVVIKHIPSLCEIPDRYDIIVNCTGLGAKNLLNDDFMVPVRGQTIKVKAPWIKHFYYGDDAYVLPGLDYVTLGGIKDYDSWNMNVNPYQKQYIWDKCTELVPSLKNAEVAWDWVGLRPYRPFVRVDASFVHCNDDYKIVVNNYGHGGQGIALSWGTAQEAAKILEKCLSEREFVISKL